MEIMNPRWSEDPGFVLEMVGGYVQSPPARGVARLIRHPREGSALLVDGDTGRVRPNPD